jgi:hypothetical protein
MPEGLPSPSMPTQAAAPAPGPAAPPAAAPAPAPKSFSQPAPRPSAPENPRARGFSPARDQREAAAARSAGEPAPDAAGAAADLQAPPPQAATGEKVRVGEYETTAEELGSMMQRQAAEDLRKVNLPPTPDAYKLEITPGAKLPGGLEFRFDGNDPGLVAAKAWAHSKGFDQGTFSEMLTMYASMVAQQETALSERSRAEIAKAGVNAGQRVHFVGRWLDGFVGKENAAPIKATLVTNSHLEAFEKIITQLTNQGGASFSQSHRATPDNAKIPGYENMSFEQRRLAQDQLAARRGGR